MKNANNFGGIQKLNGKRRKPFMAYKNVKVGTGISSCSNAAQVKDCISAQEAFKIYYEWCKKNNIPDVSVINLLQSDMEKRVSASNLHYKKIPIGYYETKRDAAIALAKYNANNIDIAGKDITFRQIAENVLRDNTSLDIGLKRLEGIADMPIADIRAEHIQKCVDKLVDVSVSTQQRTLAIIRAVFDYALKHDLVIKDYSSYASLPEAKKAKDKHPYTKEEIARLWEEIANYDAKITLVLIYTGMRIMELLSVKCEDVKDGYILVHGTKTKAAERIVPIHSKIKPIIEEMLKADSEYLISHERKKMSYFVCRRGFNELQNLLGMEHTIHETRHTFATYSLGMNEILRKFIIGHENHDMTNGVYTHQEALIPKLIEEIEKLDC